MAIICANVLVLPRLALIEPLEDKLDFTLGDTYTIVLNLNLQLPILVAKTWVLTQGASSLDGSAGRRELNGVREDIQVDLLNALRVRHDFLLASLVTQEHHVQGLGDQSVLKDPIDLPDEDINSALLYVGSLCHLH